MTATATQQQQQPPPRQLLQSLEHAAAGFVSTLLWCLASSLLIIYNKDLYDAGFVYPLMVTGMGQVRQNICG
jgi:hypothetical protein